jgi:hypothetical protein
MKHRTRKILTAAALGAAALAADSAGASQGDYFAQQRQLTDGSRPSDVPVRAAAAKRATPRQVALNRWFEVERARDTKATPFPLPVDQAVSAVAAVSATRR